MSSPMVLDAPLTVVTQIDPGVLAAINQIWYNNAILVGEICLVTGFVIGFISGYFYLKRKYANV